MYLSTEVKLYKTYFGMPECKFLQNPNEDTGYDLNYNGLYRLMV